MNCFQCNSENVTVSLGYSCPAVQITKCLDCGHIGYESIGEGIRVLTTEESMERHPRLYAIEIDYTNWKGERSLRQILPRKIYYGSNKFHPQPQWLVEAYDIDKENLRTFALNKIHSWNTHDESLVG